MKVLYRADIWLKYNVTEIQVVRETDKTVWYCDSRGRSIQELKETNNHKYFDNKEDAERHVRYFIIKEIERAERQAQYWREKLYNFNRGGNNHAKN